MAMEDKLYLAPLEKDKITVSATSPNVRHARLSVIRMI